MVRIQPSRPEQLRERKTQTDLRKPWVRRHWQPLPGPFKPSALVHGQRGGICLDDPEHDIGSSDRPCPVGHCISETTSDCTAAIGRIDPKAGEVDGAVVSRDAVNNANAPFALKGDQCGRLGARRALLSSLPPVGRRPRPLFSQYRRSPCFLGKKSLADPPDLHAVRRADATNFVVQPDHSRISRNVAAAAPVPVPKPARESGRQPPLAEQPLPLDVAKVRFTLLEGTLPLIGDRHDPVLCNQVSHELFDSHSTTRRQVQRRERSIASV